jgi:hypothetical protein
MYGSILICLSNVDSELERYALQFVEHYVWKSIFPSFAAAKHCLQLQISSQCWPSLYLSKYHAGFCSHGLLLEILDGQILVIKLTNHHRHLDVDSLPLKSQNHQIPEYSLSRCY